MADNSQLRASYLFGYLREDLADKPVEPVAVGLVARTTHEDKGSSLGWHRILSDGVEAKIGTASDKPASASRDTSSASSVVGWVITSEVCQQRRSRAREARIPRDPLVSPSKRALAVRSHLRLSMPKYRRAMRGCLASRGSHLAAMIGRTETATSRSSPNSVSQLPSPPCLPPLPGTILGRHGRHRFQTPES